MLAERIKLGCLLLGILAFGGMVQRSDRPQIQAEASEAADAAAPVDEETNTRDEAFADRMEETYRSLAEEEERMSAAFQELLEISSLEDEAERAKLEEMEMSLRYLRVQKQMLGARLEEMGRRPGEDSIKNP